MEPTTTWFRLRHRATRSEEFENEKRRMVERWNAAIAAGRDNWWSPTIRAAIVAGMPWADILPALKGFATGPPTVPIGAVIPTRTHG